MRRMFLKNVLLVGAGAGLAVLISAAAPKSKLPEDNPPAQIDRTYDATGDDGSAQSGTGGAGDAGMGMATPDGGTRMKRGSMARDGGTGGAGEAGVNQSSGNTVMTDDSVQVNDRRGTGKATAGSPQQRNAAGIDTPAQTPDDADDKATRDDHTSIIMYGPNGLRPGEKSPDED